jgi:hypothetical protein
VFLYLNRKFPDGSLRPVINTWQQLSVVLLFNSDWPESLKALGSFLQSINLELPLATPTCMGIPFNYYWRLVLMVIFTGSVIGLPWLWSLRHFRNKEKWEEHVVNRLRDTFILILIMHPSISGLAFQFFRCQKFTSPLGEDNMLVIDYSITCHDETWYGMLVFVLFVVIFFSIGMPVLFAVFLWRRRESLEDDRTKKLLGILYKTYRPSMYYYESIQMLFKVALWACLVMLEDGSQFQLALGLVICFVQVAMHARFMPFSNKWKNILQYVGLALSAGMSFAGLVINYLKEAQNNQMREGHKARAEMLKGQIEMFKHVTEVLTITSLVLVGMGALFKTWTKRKKVSKWLVKKMRKVGNKLRTHMSSNSGTGDVELPETKTAETGDAPTVMNSNPMSTVLPRETPSRSQLSPKERREVEEADKARKECERVKNESIRKQMGSFIARGEGSFIARGGGSGIRGRGRRGQISSDGGSEAKGTAAVEKAGSITRGGSGGSCGDTRHCQPDCAKMLPETKSRDGEGGGGAYASSGAGGIAAVVAAEMAVRDGAVSDDDMDARDEIAIMRGNPMNSARSSRMSTPTGGESKGPTAAVATVSSPFNSTGGEGLPALELPTMNSNPMFKALPRRDEKQDPRPQSKDEVRSFLGGTLYTRNERLDMMRASINKSTNDDVSDGEVSAVGCTSDGAGYVSKKGKLESVKKNAATVLPETSRARQASTTINQMLQQYKSSSPKTGRTKRRNLHGRGQPPSSISRGAVGDTGSKLKGVDCVLDETSAEAGVERTDTLLELAAVYPEANLRGQSVDDFEFESTNPAYSLSERVGEGSIVGRGGKRNKMNRMPSRSTSEDILHAPMSTHSGTATEIQTRDNRSEETEVQGSSRQASIEI